MIKGFKVLYMERSIPCLYDVGALLLTTRLKMENPNSRKKRHKGGRILIKRAFLVFFLILLLSPLTAFAESEVTSAADDYVISSDDIKSIQLVEMGWIEIIWNNDMYHQNDDPILTRKDNYKVMLGDEELVIG